MAEYRTVRMAFWHDPFIEELDAKAKLLYLYLFTGPYTNNFGIVEVTRKKIAYETGLSVSEVEKYLTELADLEKVILDESWIWVVNFIKNQTRTSPRILEGLQKDAPSYIPTPKLAESLCRWYPQVYKIEVEDGGTYTIPTPHGSHTFIYTCPKKGSWKLEREREEEEGGPQPPDCPHGKIREMYHETLPMLPRTMTWEEPRQELLRARWRETWHRLRKAEKPHEEADLLKWWQGFFERVRASPFLTGQVKGSNGNYFTADLEWIVRPKNYAKILDNAFCDRSAQGRLPT